MSKKEMSRVKGRPLSSSLSSTPAGIMCGSSCTHQFNSNVQVTLHADPVYSVFTGWTGDCGGTNDCELTMDADKNVTANFTEDTEHWARIGDTTTYFPTLQAAYDGAPSDSTIKVWGTGFAENLDCGQEKSVTIKGGYDTGYTGNGGFTLLHGTVTISAGSLTLENLVIL